MVFLLRYGILCLSLMLCIGVTSPAWAAGKNVVDQLGRRMVLPRAPQRVVALAPSITEIIYFLNQSHRLVGVTRFSNYPPEAASLPGVGSYVHLDLEKIVSLKPDLCIAVKDGNPQEVIERLEALGIPVYAVDPRNFTAVQDTILEIGDLLDAGHAPRALVQTLQARIERVKMRVRKTDKRPRVFFQIGINPIVTVGSDTFIHELIEIAGGQNLSAGATSYPHFSKEQVLALAPEIFIVATMARGHAFDQIKADWSRWSDMPAVKHDRIFLVDSDIFSRATHRLVDGLELLMQLIHPELMESAP